MSEFQKHITMKTKKIFTLLALLLMTINMTIKAQTFSAVCETGQSLRYSVTCQNPPEVELVYCEDYFGGLTIPDTVAYDGTNYAVVSIGDSALGSSLGIWFDGPLSIPNTVRNIGHTAFHLCFFTGPLVIPNSVETIGYRAFMSCEYFTSLTLSESLTVIEGLAFLQCRGFRGDLVIPHSVSYVESMAFADCGFDGTLFLSPNMSYIDGGFEECYGFSSIVIPEGVRGMVYGAFEALNKPTKLTLPSTLTDIDAYVFSHMGQLEQMSVKCPYPPYIHETTFLNTNRDIPIYVQIGTIEAYRNAPYWSEFTNFIEVDFDGVEEQDGIAEVTAYPNPTSDFVQIEGIIASKVLIYNTLGQLMKTVQGSNEINVSGFAEGIYLLRITDKNGIIHYTRLLVRKQT